MPMSIRNNNAANMVLGEWKKNDKSLAKDLKKAASGMKLNSAEDDASGYSISEKMRTQLRSLNQDIMNSQTGASLMHVAEGGIQNIVDELRSLKELAINAANDHNTDADRATLQKEFEQRSADIEDIASSTNYNGKLLLRGDYPAPKAILPPGVEALKKMLHPAKAVADLSPVGTISGTSFTVTQNGLYNIDPSFTGTISMASNVTDVELVGPGSTLSNVYIAGNSNGNFNLILKNYQVNNTNVPSVTATTPIRFSGTNNQLILKGTNSISEMPPVGSSLSHATINTGQGLTILGGDTGGSGTLKIPSGGTAGAAIGTDSGQNSSKADLIISSGTVDINGEIGGGSWGEIGNIVIGDATITCTHIGSGIGGTAKDIYIGNGATITTNGIGSHTNSYTGPGTYVGDITIDHAAITIPSTFGGGAGIGSGESKNTQKDEAGNITITNSTLNITATGDGAAIGSGAGSGVGTITIGAGNTLNVTSKNGDAIGLGVNGYYTSKKSSGITYVDGHPLVIHTGTKANQAMHCFLESMDLKHLGIAETEVTTRQKATDALDTIDNAINYALDQQTTVGSYISRLRYTASNLTTASENTQASESTIRDADMAKTMMAYARDNVLSQSAQTMLSQANQSASSVLSLLQ